VVTSEGTVNQKTHHTDVAVELETEIRAETPSDVAMELEREMRAETPSDVAMELDQDVETQDATREPLGIQVYENPKSWRPLTSLSILREPNGNVDLDALFKHLTLHLRDLPEKGTLRVNNVSFYRVW
jgi:hypothetical protein